ncbi:MAG: hypothetical protein HZB26_22045 [Candidatus Hydrogenedentes bacterium]|nr:hypothetical protein [Candidatus Hydrogenedentota bacterium]
MSILRRIGTGGAGWWRAIALDTRCRAVVVALTAPVAAFFMLDAAQGPQSLTVLYDGLSDHEAVAVRQALETRRVPFELDNGGRTILAPASQCAELRVEFDTRVLPWIRLDVWKTDVTSGDIKALRGVSSSGLHDHFTTAQEYGKQGAAG